MARIVRFLRYEGAREKQGQPTVLFLGSSRFQSCIVPAVFEEQARQWGADVRFINVSHPGVDWWEFSRLIPYVDLRRLNARACVIEVNPWAFNRLAKRRPYGRECPVWGRYDDVMSVPGFKARVEIAWSLTFPRRTVTDWYSVFRGALDSTPADERLPTAEYQFDPVLEAKQRANPTFMTTNIVQTHMFQYTFSSGKAAAFRAFLADLRAQGIEIVLVHPPVNGRYFDYIRASEERSFEYARHLAFLGELSREFRIYAAQIPADIGLDDTIFVDYGHFTFAGARAFSELLALSMKDLVEGLKTPTGGPAGPADGVPSRDSRGQPE